MAFKLIESAQTRWRAVNAPHLVALVRADAVFKNGKLMERPDESEGGDLTATAVELAPLIWLRAHADQPWFSRYLAQCEGCVSSARLGRCRCLISHRLRRLTTCREFGPSSTSNMLHVHIVEIVLIQRTRRIRQCVENFYWADREITPQFNRQSQSLTWRDTASRVQLCQ